MSRFGKTEANGTQTQPTECILTGRPVTVENSVRLTLTPPYFCRVLSSQAHRITDDLRTQWAAEASGGGKAAPQARPSKAEEN